MLPAGDKEVGQQLAFSNMNIEQDGQLHKLVRKINRTTHPLNGRGTHVKFLTGEQLLEPEQPVLPGSFVKLQTRGANFAQSPHSSFQLKHQDNSFVQPTPRRQTMTSFKTPPSSFSSDNSVAEPSTTSWTCAVPTRNS
ncbi:unnamed protein product [Caenorhabditis brenneri]